MDELHHECGIAAIYHLPGADASRLAPLQGPEQVSRLMPRMLLDLQNRGQLAAGFATFNPRREKLLDTYKQIGTVIEAFRLNHQAKYESIMREFAGRAAIGHVRYATCGATDQQLRPAVRAASRLQMEMVRLRLQRPTRQLRRTPRPTPHPDRLSPHPQHRHRSHHALPQPRAEPVRRRPSRSGRGVSQPEPANSTAPTTWCSSTPWATWWCCAIPTAFGRCAIAQDGTAVRRRQRERAAVQPRLQGRPLAGARRDDPDPGRRDSPRALRRRGRRRRIASSSGFISPTSPARSTSAAST